MMLAACTSYRVFAVRGRAPLRYSINESKSKRPAKDLFSVSNQSQKIAFFLFFFSFFVSLFFRFFRGNKEAKKARKGNKMQTFTFYYLNCFNELTYEIVKEFKTDIAGGVTHIFFTTIDGDHRAITLDRLVKIEPVNFA